MTESIAPWVCAEPFAHRPIKFKEIIHQAGWRLKLYVILYPSAELRWDILEEAVPIGINALPQPAITTQRPGLGFMIAHQGRDRCFLPVFWWDQENELRQLVYVRGFGEDDSWQPARNGESFCVWDMEVMWFEREAFVNAILSHPDAPDVEGYLEQRLYG